MNIDKLEVYIREYLLTLHTTNGEDRYNDYRGFAEDELIPFLNWVRILEEKNEHNDARTT